MIYNARELKLNMDGRVFDYITFGKGQRPLVMIQWLNTRGLKGSAVPLAYMYREFARDYTVYLFDRRPDVPAGFTVRDMASDIAGAMDALAIADADVFGVSQGGMTAQYLAIDRPDLVRKLVLAVTLSRNNETVQSAIHHWITLTEEGRFKALAYDMAARMYSDAYLKRYKLFMPLLAVWNKPKDAKRFVRLAEACLTCDTFNELDRIQCPVLVIGGKQDKIVGGDASVELAQQLGCQMHMYEELGHAAYEEAKDFNKRVREFLLGE